MESAKKNKFRFPDHRGRMFLLGLSLLIPVLLISFIGISSTARQKQSRLIDLRNEWHRNLERFAIDLEKELVILIKAVFDDFSLAEPLIDNPWQLQQKLRQFQQEFPIVSFPFVISLDREYLYPFSRPMISLPDSLEFTAFSSAEILQDFRSGEEFEYLERNWPAAIKNYLAGLKKASAGLENKVFLLAVARCYFKWARYRQAAQYLTEMIRVMPAEEQEYQPLLLRARQLLALVKDRLDDKLGAAEEYLLLYEDVLALQAVRQSDLLDYYRNEAFDYLSRNPSDSVSWKNRFEENMGQQALATLPERETSFDWQFFTLYEMGTRADQQRRQWGIETHRLQQIQEFYLANDQKNRFYSELREKLLFPEAMMPENHDFARHFGLEVVYAAFHLLENHEKKFYFGFKTNLEYIKKELFPGLLKKNWPDPQTSLVMASRQDMAGQLEAGIPVLILDDFLPQSFLTVKTPRPGYIEARIERELMVNYILISALILTMPALLILFMRSLGREMEVMAHKGSFLDSAAHTLKTPLARIRLLAEQLHLNWLKDDKRRLELSQKIVSEADQMNSLLANLLDFSRIEAGFRAYSFRPLSFAELAREIWEEALPRLRENGFSCHFSIGDDLPDINADERSLRMMMANLIQNAIDYSVERKEIEFKVFRLDNEVVLEVADYGPGIEPRYQQAVFEKFFRIDKEKALSCRQGSGLGLYLVRQTVDAHHGRLELRSLPGQGARFIISLPATGTKIPKRRKRNHGQDTGH